MIQSDIALHAGPLAHVDSLVGLVAGVALFGLFVVLLRRTTTGRDGRR